MAKLYLGGIRSGKSQIAESYCLSQNQLPIGYVATAQPALADKALKDRITAHVNRRDPSQWALCEAQEDLKSTVILALKHHERVLIDSIDMWLALLSIETTINRQLYDAFLTWVAEFASSDNSHRLIIVSSETGLAPVANNELTRNFVDNLGGTNQVLAQHCSDVSLCVAGIELPIKCSNK